ncbi:glycosyltransferase family 39 protein, partial [Candidatus Desantisbacteria bacterium]|nr:glycosyltransferase family 39 protein [Candidatus Desantisbacteria bacterium]
TLALAGEEGRLIYVFGFWREWDFNPHWFTYPQGYFYAAFILQWIVFAGGKILGIYKNVSEFTAQFALKPHFFYFLARLTSTFFGTASVYAIYRVGKKYFNETAGLLSAFFLSFSPLHVKYSQEYYPDVFVTLFILLAFIPIYNIYINGKTRDYILAGILIGLGIGTKYFPAAIILELGLAHILYIKHEKISWKNIINKNLIICIIFIGIVFFISSPYSIINFGEVSKFLANRGNDLPGKWFGFEKSSDSKILHHLTVNLPSAISLTLEILGFLGIAYALFKIFKELKLKTLFDKISLYFPSLFLILFLITFFILIERGGLHFINYMVTALPFFLLFAAFFLVEIIQKIRINTNLQKIAVICIALLVSSENINACLKNGYYMSQKNTRIEGVEWIEANIPAGAKIVGTTYSPPLLYGDEILETLNDPMYKEQIALIKEKLLSRPRYQFFILPWIPQYYDLNLLKEKFDYIIIDSGIYARHQAAPEFHPTEVNFYQDLDKRCVLIKLIEGEPKQPGPTIKIYK